MPKTLEITTRCHCEMINITAEVEQAAIELGLVDGFVHLWVPHTTAGITVNENADPDVPHDILLSLERMIPVAQIGFRHTEGNSDAHLKSSLVGCSLTIPVERGGLVLGTWQGVFFCEFDGPRSRELVIRAIPLP